MLLEATTGDAPLVEPWSWAERVWGDPRTEAREHVLAKHGRTLKKLARWLSDFVFLTSADSQWSRKVA